MRNYQRILIGLMLGCLALAPALSASAQEPVKKQERPRVEVVFCRDAGQSEQRIPVGASPARRFPKVLTKAFLDEFVFR